MARFIQIAMGSAAELSYHLLVARDLSFIDPQRWGHLEEGVSEVSRMLSALSQRLKERDTGAPSELKAKG
jgi:four helix bundle protein